MSVAHKGKLKTAMPMKNIRQDVHRYSTWGARDRNILQSRPSKSRKCFSVAAIGFCNSLPKDMR